MGEVYLARDTDLGRRVALKILRADGAGDPRRMQRFDQEARAASSLNHPNVAQIYEIGKVNGDCFIAMEFVEGQTLDEKINGQPLSVEEITGIGLQIADALEDAHSKEIIHRDIKPSNIMITSRGQAKVLDFGLAKIPSADAETPLRDRTTQARTEPGLLLGTIPYMSPEQALGHELDHRTDIFSLGVVLYEMATGRLPFCDPNPLETLNQIAHSQPRAIGIAQAGFGLDWHGTEAGLPKEGDRAQSVVARLMH